MPAITNEPFRGVAIVRLTDATGTRAYTLSIDDVDPLTVATNQSTWEGTPGSSLTLRLEWATSGAPAFAAADDADAIFYIPASTQIGSTIDFNPSGDSGSATATIHFDADPGNQSAADAIRAGMFEIELSVRRTTAVTWGAVTSRGTGTPPAATTLNWGRGYVRAPVTLSAFSISDASLGGAEPGAFYATKATYNRVTLDAAWYRAQLLTLKHRQSSTDIRSSDADTPTDTAAVRNYTWNATAVGAGNKGRINEDYAAASTVTDVQINLPVTAFGGSNDAEYVWAASGHPAGWTRVDDNTMRYTSRITVDPRVQCVHHFQVDNNTFTLASDDNTNQMLSTQSGFLWTILKDMAGTGLNGLTIQQTLTPVNPGTAVSDAATATTTQDGQVGVSGRLDWTASKPGGTWNKTIDISAPSDMDLDALEVSGTDAYVMLNADPRIRILCGGGDLTNPKKHWSPGQSLTVGLSVLRAKTRIAFDTGTASCGVFRMNPSLGRAEYWDGAAWSFGDSPTFFSMSPSAGDSKLALKTFAAGDTTSWSYDNLFFVGYCEVSGTPYTGPGFEEVVDSYFKHDGSSITSVTVQDNSGSPSVAATTIKVPSGSLTDEGNGVARLDLYSGGGVKLISIDEIEKKKRKKTLENLLDEEYSNDEFKKMLDSLAKKFQSTEPGARQLTDDEEALLHILMLVNSDKF